MKKRERASSFFNKNENCKFAKVNLTLVVFLFLSLIVLISLIPIVNAENPCDCKKCTLAIVKGTGSQVSSDSAENPPSTILVGDCKTDDCKTCECKINKKACDKLSKINSNIDDVLASMNNLNYILFCGSSSGELNQKPIFSPITESIERGQRAMAARAIVCGLLGINPYADVTEAIKAEMEAIHAAEEARLKLKAKMEELARNAAESELNELGDYTNSLFNDLKKCSDKN